MRVATAGRSALSAKMWLRSAASPLPIVALGIAFWLEKNDSSRGAPRFAREIKSFDINVNRCTGIAKIDKEKRYF